MASNDTKPLTILLFGKNGQLGYELVRRLESHHDGIRLIALGREQCNLKNADHIIDSIRKYHPDMIINAAAYTAVDLAESEPALAYRINTIAPRVMAQQAENIGAWFVHYSTDYVFDGEKISPYTEEDKTNPLNVYGNSKRKGELEIQRYASNYVIFRTS